MKEQTDRLNSFELQKEYFNDMATTDAMYFNGAIFP